MSGIESLRFRFAAGLLAVLLLGGAAFLRAQARDKRSDQRPPASARATLERYIGELQSRYKSVQTLQAAFTQTYTWAGQPRQESGVAYFSRGGLMRWDYRDPKNKLVVSDGKTLWLYVPDEKQVTRSLMKSNEDTRLPFPLLVADFNLRKIFSRIESADQALKADAGDHVLRGYARRGDQDVFSQVLLEVTPRFDIRRLVVFYPDHSVMQFEFDKIERNVALNPRLFEFTPPPGAEVIDESQ